MAADECCRPSLLVGGTFIAKAERIGRMSMNKLPENLTIGEAYGPAMEITEQAKADEYFELLVQRAMKFHKGNRGKAEAQEKSNLGYYAGYYDSETRARVEKLFSCTHPIFGPISKGTPTAEEAFEMGKKLAKVPVDPE